jgi:hypothetical protein
VWPTRVAPGGADSADDKDCRLYVYIQSNLAYVCQITWFHPSIHFGSSSCDHWGFIGCALMGRVSPYDTAAMNDISEGDD